ncbi:hypothetical protein [Chitinophaga sp. OAE865]|uniref:hypothetical protein n=1 Tax=Chitinophaga sp. OAE865 TaxID=2817898 RepID=UPI001AE1D7B1
MQNKKRLLRLPLVMLSYGILASVSCNKASKDTSLVIKKPVEQATNASNPWKGKTGLMIAAVEANDHYFANVLCYKDTAGKFMFDMAFPFSANINIDQRSVLPDPTTPGKTISNTNYGKAYIQYNAQHVAMMKPGGVFDKVKAAGMPVGLSILGNWDEAGWDNFKTLADATAFAGVVAKEVREKGFKAILADDEYSRHASGAHPSSYVMVMSEIKRLLPDIFLCYYQYGAGAVPYTKPDGTTIRMGDVADAIICPYYPQYPDADYLTTYGFQKNKWFATATEDAYSTDYAQKAKADGIGGMFFFDVRGRSSSPNVYRPFAQKLKNMKLADPSGCLYEREFSGVNDQVR